MRSLGWDENMQYRQFIWLMDGAHTLSQHVTWTVFWLFTQQVDAASNSSSSCGPWRISTAQHAASASPSVFFTQNRLVMLSDHASAEGLLLD